MDHTRRQTSPVSPRRWSIGTPAPRCPTTRHGRGETAVALHTLRLTRIRPAKCRTAGEQGDAAHLSGLDSLACVNSSGRRAAARSRRELVSPKAGRAPPRSESARCLCSVTAWPGVGRLSTGGRRARNWADAIVRSGVDQPRRRRSFRRRCGRASRAFGKTKAIAVGCESGLGNHRGYTGGIRRRVNDADHRDLALGRFWKRDELSPHAIG